MANENAFFGKVAPFIQSLLRIAIGILFAEHGGQKLLGYPPGGHKVEQLMSLQGIGGILELVGGVLFFFGIFTRPVAFILSGEMAVAYFKFHAAGGFWPVQNKGELAVVYCFVFFFFAAAGAGPLSIDAAWKKS
jgi:putative oxidoreductase